MILKKRDDKRDIGNVPRKHFVWRHQGKLQKGGDIYSSQTQNDSPALLERG